MPDHVLLMAGNLENHLDQVQERCTVHRWYDTDDRDTLLQAVGEKIRVVGTNGHVGVPADVMARLPNLEMIGCYGVGYDAIDVEVARQRKIAVTNTPDVLSDAVAELALGLMIALARRIPQSDRFVRTGSWLEGDYPLTSELSGRTVGIVGLGRIGKELARRLQAMKMRVVYHGRHEQSNEPYQYYSDIVAMAAAVDWMVLCLPGGDDAQHIVSATVLAALGSAALDVFAEEPKVPAALLEADNVVLSPHAASATAKTRHDMGELVIKNILAHLDGMPLLTRVA